MFQRFFSSKFECLVRSKLDEAWLLFRGRETNFEINLSHNVFFAVVVVITARLILPPLEIAWDWTRKIPYWSCSSVIGCFLCARLIDSLIVPGFPLLFHQVSKAIPCRSLSTGLQCEMDPVSQTQASEELALRGLAVVGWYHSHPTFAPIPSVRDIETQAKFQVWF